MGAGKSTLGPEVAARLGRQFLDLDQELERSLGRSIPEFLSREGEAEFRLHEARLTVDALSGAEPAVLALGGGAVETAAVRDALGKHAFAIHLPVDPDAAWERARGSGRPFAQDADSFRALHERRGDIYEEAADATADDLDGVVLAAAGIHVGIGSLELLGTLVPGDGPVALVTDPHVGGIHGAATQLALGGRVASTHEVPAGESGKTPAVLEGLWEELELDRGGRIVALGGGSTTDVAGLAAATYLRGIPWAAVPTSLVGQVDAAIGGKTAVDLPAGKNLAGAFHWPAQVVIDPALLETLPKRERSEGMAEVVKTGLLAGEPLWELPDQELVRRCASFKAAVCLRDPYDRGERAILNLGHTFAHALEAAAGYRGLSHGAAVGLGLLAALRLSGRATDAVEQVLAPRRANVDRERAWAALLRDKKVRAGELHFVLLGEDGASVQPVHAKAARVALDELITD